MQDVTNAPPSAAELSRQIRQQVREQVRAAREQALQAKNQAGQAVAVPAVPAVPGAPAPPSPEVLRIQTPNGTVQIPTTEIPQAFPFLGQQVEHIAISFFVMVVAIVFVIPVARAFARRIERKTPPPPLDPALAEQLQRIEQSVDAMAIEIERISEAQRYMARLSTERADPALPPKQAAS